MSMPLRSAKRSTASTKRRVIGPISADDGALQPRIYGH